MTFKDESQTHIPAAARPERLTALAVQARHILREGERFAARFPPAAANETLMPAFTWNQLERQLLDLAEDKRLSPLVRTTLAQTARRADHLPAELLLREILVLAAVIQEGRPPTVDDAEAGSLTA